MHNLVDFYKDKKVIIFLKSGFVKSGLLLSETPNFLILHSFKEGGDISIPIADIEDIKEWNGGAKK